MATSLGLRRGLPRLPGGEPWPPPGTVEVDDRPDFLAQTAGDVPTVVPAAPEPAARTDVPTRTVPAVAPAPATAPASTPTLPPAAAGQARSVPLRRGLPRTPYGEPWPPAGTALLTVPGEAFDLAPVAAAPSTARAVDPSPAPAGAPVAPTPTAAASAAPLVADAPSTSTVRVPLRRGLPRTAGGEAWPPAGVGVLLVATAPLALDTSEEARPHPTAAPAAAAPPRAAQPVGALGETRTDRVALRRGLPRVAGGEPWPPAGSGALTVLVAPEPVPAPAVAPPGPSATEVAAPVQAVAPAARAPEAPAAEAAPPPAAPVRPAAASRPTPAPSPTPAPRPAAAATVAPEPGRPGVLVTASALVRRFPAVAVVVAIALVGVALALAGWFTGTTVGAAFLARFPGSYALPAAADPGFPAWARWNHFLNLFFIVLIIRSGLGVRYEKKPPAYWTPRTPALGGKISLTLWLHQTLDVLWVLNGFAFLTLLFATDHWMRIVPTSWEVFPNAVSAALQYATFDWPAEAGWTNYNSLQQLAYFTVVFVAAPVAALTGVRMSGLWPARARRLSALYPVELARAVHFPTMIFFVVFVVGHVSMVFLTGARANLNHMFAGTDGHGWAGFWVFVGAMAVLAAGWELARPTLLAPLANLLGRVSQR